MNIVLQASISHVLRLALLGDIHHNPIPTSFGTGPCTQVHSPSCIEVCPTRTFGSETI
jgi:hypothetical protein